MLIKVLINYSAMILIKLMVGSFVGSFIVFICKWSKFCDGFMLEAKLVLWSLVLWRSSLLSGKSKWKVKPICIFTFRNCWLCGEIYWKNLFGFKPDKTLHFLFEFIEWNFPSSLILKGKLYRFLLSSRLERSEHNKSSALPRQSFGL